MGGVPLSPEGGQYVLVRIPVPPYLTYHFEAGATSCGLWNETQNAAQQPRPPTQPNFTHEDETSEVCAWCTIYGLPRWLLDRRVCLSCRSTECGPRTTEHRSSQWAGYPITWSVFILRLRITFALSG